MLSVHPSAATLEGKAYLRRDLTLLGSAMLFGLLVLQVILQPLGPLPVVAIAGLLVLTLVAAALYPRASAQGVEALTITVGAAGSGVLVAVAADSGGTASTYFAFMYATPIIMALLFADSMATTLSACAVNLVGGVAIHVLEHQPAAVLGQWFVLEAACGAFGAYAIVAHQRLRAGELRARDERAEALRELVVSERRREHLERMATVGRLAAGVAHEINNPLAFVKSNVAWMQRARREGTLLRDEPELDAVLTEIKGGVERMQVIVSDLKTFARDEPAHAGEFRLIEAVQDAIRLASSRLHAVARVQVDLDQRLPSVKANRCRFLQVLVNLLVNAADAIEEGQANGSRREAVVRVSASEAGGVIEVCVEDSGPGIPPHVAARLFEPFFTTKAPGKGTGLGLAISREHALAWGGNIEAGSAPGGGARFIARVPVAGDAADRLAG